MLLLFFHKSAGAGEGAGARPPYTSGPAGEAAGDGQRTRMQK